MSEMFLNIYGLKLQQSKMSTGKKLKCVTGLERMERDLHTDLLPPEKIQKNLRLFFGARNPSVFTTTTFAAIGAAVNNSDKMSMFGFTDEFQYYIKDMPDNYELQMKTNTYNLLPDDIKLDMHEQFERNSFYEIALSVCHPDMHETYGSTYEMLLDYLNIPIESMRYIPITIMSQLLATAIIRSYASIYSTAQKVRE